MEASRGLLRDRAGGPTKGLLGVRGPVEGTPMELANVPAGDTGMEPVSWLLGVRGPVEGRPRELTSVPTVGIAMGLARWLFTGPVRRLASVLFCVMGPGEGSSVLKVPIMGLTMGPVEGLGCGPFSMSARGARAITPTSSRTGSFAAAGCGGRKTPGGHRESTETPKGPGGRGLCSHCGRAWTKVPICI